MLALTVLENAVSATERTKPHILLITSDQQRTDSIRAYGRERAKSPALDRLAASGVTFLSAYTSSPICIPARVSWLTSRHANVHRCGMSDVTERHPRASLFTLGSCDFQRESTLPYLMRTNGYRTIAVGKAHYFRYEPRDLFDVYIGRWDTGVNARANGAQGKADWSKALTPDYYVAKNPRASFPETLMMRAMLMALQRSMRRWPTFAWFSIESPHEPIWIPSDAAALMHRVEPPPLKLNDTLAQHIALSSCKALTQSHWRRAVSENRSVLADGPLLKNATKKLAMEWYRRAYYASVLTNVDRPVAQLLVGIEAFRNRTIVVFTSDHGNMNWDHGWGAPPPLGDAKGIFYDESWRIPLIVSLPTRVAVPRGVQTQQLVSSIDLTATLLEAAGVPVHAPGSASPSQGISFYAQLMRGENSSQSTRSQLQTSNEINDGRRLAVAGYVADLRGALGCGEAMAVVGRRFKLALYTGLAPGGENLRGTGRPTGMLFDLLRDPDESHDLFCAEHTAHVRGALEEALLEWHAGQRSVRRRIDLARGRTVSIGLERLRAPDRKLEHVVSAVESGCAHADEPYLACCSGGADCVDRPASATWISTLACAPPEIASPLFQAMWEPEEKAQRRRDASRRRQQAYELAQTEVLELERRYNESYAREGRPAPNRALDGIRVGAMRDALLAKAPAASLFARPPRLNVFSRPAAVRRVHVR